MVGEKGDIKGKGKKGRTKTGVDGKIPWNKETRRGGHIMRAPRRKQSPMHLNT